MVDLSTYFTTVNSPVGAPIVANTVHFLKLCPRSRSILHPVETVSRFGAPSDTAVLRLVI